MKTTIALLVPLLLVSMTALACEKPLVIGTIENKAGGEILFLSRSVHCINDPGQDALSYTSGGGTTLKGCWLLNGELVFVTWENGREAVYPLSNATQTPESVAYMQCKDKPKKSRAQETDA